MREKKILFFLFISISLHLFVLTIVHRKKFPLQKSEESLIIEIVESPKTDFAKTEKGQIVDQSEQPLNDLVPNDSKFLSLHNQKVVNQTKAARNGKFNNKIKAGPQLPAAHKNHQFPSPHKNLLDEESKMDKNLLARLTPGYKWPGPQPEVPSTDDYLKDIKDGVQTLLSTREFVYYTYYKRIKDQLAQYWEPKIKDKVLKLLQQGRNIASSGDKITRLIITLNNKGVLIRVQIVSASGIKDLDDAAVEAFRAAAPFPNPPKGIIEKDGNIRITWDFVLEV